MATIYQVSDLAGVSLATVSRVINKNAKVSDKTKEKVLDAMRTLDYRPNASAQSLASNRSNCVGILVSELKGSFFGPMMAAIESQLRTYGKHVIITTGLATENNQSDGIEFLKSRNCDAIIIHDDDLTDEYIIKLSKDDVPIYLISRYIKELANNCITLDDNLGGFLATQEVIKNGHHKIAYISGPKQKKDAQNRLKGHKLALNKAKIRFDEKMLYIGDYSEKSGSDGLKHLLNSNVTFTALVCANDEMASGAMKFAREKNLKLPQDLSIIGYDNIAIANYLYPTLTTVCNPVQEMGVMASKLVLRDIYKQKIDDIKSSFNPKLVIRDSIIKI